MERITKGHIERYLNLVNGKFKELGLNDLEWEVQGRNGYQAIDDNKGHTIESGLSRREQYNCLKSAFQALEAVARGTK